jgi:MHS family proline/betaine transporter-like MFS transporter
VAWVAEWGWRVLFLLSVPMGLVAFYIRSKLHESPEFEAMVKDSANRPTLCLGEVIHSQWAQMLKLGGFVMLTARQCSPAWSRCCSPRGSLQ